MFEKSFQRPKDYFRLSQNAHTGLTGEDRKRFDDHYTDENGKFLT